MKKFTYAILQGLFVIFCCLHVNANYNNNYSASFNGKDAYLTMPQTDGDMQLHDPFTIEFWMKPKAYPAAGTFAALFQKANPVAGAGIYIIMDDQGLVGVNINGSYYTMLAPCVIDFWTHITVSYYNSTLRLYYNGSVVLSQPLAGGDVYQLYPTYIGAMADQAGTMLNFYKGEIDELRIWSEARGDFNVENYHFQSVTGMGAAHSSLRVSLPFNNNFTDQGGKEFNTVINNKVKFVNYVNSDPNYLAYNSSLYDNNSQLFIRDNTDLDASSALSLEFWGRFTGGHSISIDKGIGDFNYFLEYGIDVNKYFITFQYQYSGGTRYATAYIPQSVHIASRSWNHIAFTYKASTGNMKFYFNGAVILDTIVAPGENLIPNNNLFIIDCDNGCIDELRIWKNTVRNATQIKSDMFKAYSYTMNPKPANVDVYDFDGRMDNVMDALPDSNKTIYHEGTVNYKIYDHFPKSNITADRNTAPLISDEKNYFGDDTKYTMSTKRLYVDANTSASFTDSVFVPGNGNISDLKLYVFGGVTRVTPPDSDGISQKITLTLTSPSGKKVQLTPQLNSDYIGDLLYSVFDMNAANTISYDDYYGIILPPFSPEIKPYQSFKKFNGLQEHGWWKLKFETTGFKQSLNAAELLGWGIYPVATAAINSVTSEDESRIQGSDKFTVIPNPVMSSAIISYQLIEKSDVHISVIDANGKIITQVFNKKDQETGTHTINVDMRKLTAGIYFCRIKEGSKAQTIKIVKQ